jgi:hypothetical protein
MKTIAEVDAKMRRLYYLREGAESKEDWNAVKLLDQQIIALAWVLHDA